MIASLSVLIWALVTTAWRVLMLLEETASRYLLNPWCRILFEKLIVTQLVKNIPLSYGTRRFITVFTKARHWTLS
jgi:hypothetical protein